jgi:DNA-binding PucR family transcriptional regulator
MHQDHQCMVLSVHEWPTLSARGAELIRDGARIVLNPRAEWLEELHEASLGGETMRQVTQDPALAEGIRRTNLANLMQWATANLQHPGRRVPPALGPEGLATARDLVRRGLDAAALDAYRTGQNLAWRRWMEICFELTDDPAELRELLEVSALSINTFIDDTIAAIAARMEEERAELTRGTHAERRATVALLLEGAPVSRERAEGQLGYRLGGRHTAAILWGPPDIGSEELEAAAEAVMKAAGAERRLTVLASAAALWVWMAVPAPTRARMVAAVAGHPRIRLAVGRAGTDLDGFRRSHLDAAVTQQMLADHPAGRQVATYSDVQLVALLTRDPNRAQEFVTDCLGELADAEPELRDIVLTFIREQCNASRAATVLYTHRNTVLRRLARADELLPRPLAENVIRVGAALELVEWRAG